MTDAEMHTRTIPSSGLKLPVIGCGTWKGFDVGATEKERAPLTEVLSTLFAFGGSVIDSSPMYGRAEQVAGELLTGGNWREKAFVATKVWIAGRDAGIRQMRRSAELLQKKRIDLMQIHNLLDWRAHLATLRAWKAEGRIGYLGVTHYTAGAYRELETILRAETLDFVRLNYSLDDREAERRLLPLAADRGIAVLANLPFGAGRLLRTLRGKPLPLWAHDVECESWAQVLLKFVLSQTAVTCVIPGTARPEHMAENCRAGMGRFLDDGLRKRLTVFGDVECK